jgi:hypothetical protein
MMACCKLPANREFKLAAPGQQRRRHSARPDSRSDRTPCSGAAQAVTLGDRVAAPIGGSARGYQAILVPLAAVSTAGYDPMDGQPAEYFSLSHKRRRAFGRVWQAFGIMVCAAELPVSAA